MSETVLDRIVACLRAALDFNPNVHEAPIALLWPDEGQQWLPIVERIGERLPLVSLGEYDPAARRGPSYWLRCVVAGTIDAGLPQGTPVVYLPGVSRSAIRGADDCPPEIAPIAALQYRSQWFSHPNNRDWTVRALLANRERGLGLDLAEDAETRAALLLALEPLVEERADRVEKQLLDADYLLELVNEDPVRDLLTWLDDPPGFRERSDGGRWTAFVQQCKADYELDPAADGEIAAARMLGARQGSWRKAWKRFAEAPERYPGVVAQLRKARPEELVVDHPDAWPQDNEEAEDRLRGELQALEALAPEAARSEALQLEGEHAWRRGTVWAELDRAPLAFALEQLAALAEATEQPLAGGDLDSLVADYAERGWRADDAVLRALAAAPSAEDRRAVSAAVSAVYRFWLDAGARALQELLAGPGGGGYRPAGAALSAAGTVTVFVDGLRMDVGRRVQERLADAGLEVSSTISFAALPTVTATAKPALAPVAAGTLGPGPELDAANAETGARGSMQALRSLMTANGVQVLGSAETGDPSRPAWTEAGDVDHRGHDAGARLADSVDEVVAEVAGRVRELLEAGWERVEVVTDHGWMLLPGGMEKVELPPASAEVKKGRCARLKPGASVEAPTAPWHWDPAVRIALAPGASCFEAGVEYEHGGVSPQECVVARLAVSAGAAAATTGGPELTGVKWLGLLCRVEFGGVSEKVIVDLRGLPGEPGSSIAERAKETTRDGRVSLLVPDEEHEGERAHLVLVAPDGSILAQREVVVGRNR